MVKYFNGKKFVTNVRANRPTAKRPRKQHNRNLTFKGKVTITAPKKGFIEFSNKGGNGVILKNPVNIVDADFLDDEEKMRDFKIQTKDEFLRRYDEETKQEMEQEYDNTLKRLQDFEGDFEGDKVRLLFLKNHPLSVEDTSFGKRVEFDDGTEWYVFDSYAEAKQAAIEDVEEQLDDEPENFETDWIQQHIFISDTDKRIMAGEEADREIEDRDDSEVIEMAERQGIETKGRAIDEIKERYTESRFNDIEIELDDPIQYFEDQGLYSKEELMKQPFIQIDTRNAAQDAVETDGVAHFLSSYDGKEVELSDGTYMYRIN